MHGSEKGMITSKQLHQFDTVRMSEVLVIVRNKHRVDWVTVSQGADDDW